MKNLLCSLLLSVSVPKSRMNLITSLLRRLRGFEHALLLWRSKLASRVIPADQWPRCPFCDGRGGILHWRMVDEDEWEPQDEMCEGCDATGRINPSHLQEYELACASGRDDLELWRLPF